MLTKNFNRVRSCKVLHDRKSLVSILLDKNSADKNFYGVRSDKTSYKKKKSTYRNFYRLRSDKTKFLSCTI